jgi:signal-transduction protein with cAMP-binding, CBS, and nucleotidyltransferase domain
VVVKGKQSSSTKVSDIMTPSEVLLTVTPQHSVLDVMELMVDKNVRHLPVIDEGNMVGMISIKDVVHVMLKEHRWGQSARLWLFAGLVVGLQGKHALCASCSRSTSRAPTN